MSSQQSGLVAGNAQNEARGTVPRSRSRFPLSDSTFTTERFADYSPCFVMEGVSGDKITLNQPHQVRTYSLKSPLLQDILKKKDYFMVPMMAILPLNWEKFYTNPPIGDDVPLGVGTGVPNFWGRLFKVFSSDTTALKNYLSATHTLAEYLSYILKYLVYYEMFYSNGSLLKSLRISGNAYLSMTVNRTIDGVSTNPPIDFDSVFDQVLSVLTDSSDGIKSFVFTQGTKVYTVVSGPKSNEIGSDSGGYPVIGFREVLELLRDNLDFSISNVVSLDNSDPWLTQIGTFLNAIYITPNYVVDSSTDGIPLNLARLWAYQIVCAHYYSNDHVDVIYSAELYRQYIYSLITNTFSSATISAATTVFSYNGMNYQFDYLSAYLFNKMATGTSSASYSTAFSSCFSKGAASLAYFTSLFGYKKSLRFMDYFTGSRSRPLAIGNETTIDTSGSSVGVIDVARKFQYTRFYQAVNRSGRKFSAYMKELFGIVPKPDYHNPFYLAHTSDVVGSSETENTGAAQLTQANSITSVLRSNAARYAFTFEPDRDCIIIGISYYDLPRVYSRATERQNFYLDRFDMFNPFLQYLGDQGIYNAELGTPSPSLTPFSYTNRDMEYKQRYNFASGAFSVLGSQLQEWYFNADVLRRVFGTSIGSSFIRSFNSEFDRFYVSLTGFSLGTYFHFIVRYDDRCDASRPMAYAPGIMQ